MSSIRITTTFGRCLVAAAKAHVWKINAAAHPSAGVNHPLLLQQHPHHRHHVGIASQVVGLHEGPVRVVADVAEMHEMDGGGELLCDRRQVVGRSRAERAGAASGLKPNRFSELYPATRTARSPTILSMTGCAMSTPV